MLKYATGSKDSLCLLSVLRVSEVSFSRFSSPERHTEYGDRAEKTLDNRLAQGISMATKFSEDKQDEKLLENGLPPVDLELIAQGVRMILEGLGENPERPGLRDTPQRVAEMYAELTSGMREDPKQHVVPLPGDKH